MCDKGQKWHDRNMVNQKFKLGDQDFVLATSKQNKLAAT